MGAASPRRGGRRGRRARRTPASPAPCRARRGRTRRRRPSARSISGTSPAGTHRRTTRRAPCLRRGPELARRQVAGEHPPLPAPVYPARPVHDPSQARAVLLRDPGAVPRRPDDRRTPAAARDVVADVRPRLPWDGRGPHATWRRMWPPHASGDPGISAAGRRPSGLAAIRICAQWTKEVPGLCLSRSAPRSCSLRPSCRHPLPE